MVDIMKGVKWAVGWKNKNTATLTQEELKEKLFMEEQNVTPFTPKRGEPIPPTVYPLTPVKAPNKIKRLPTHLKKVKYRKGRVN